MIYIYQRRLCRYQAYYSLDYALTAENERALLDAAMPEDMQEQKERRQKLQKASERSPHPSSGASIKGTFSA